MSQPSKKTVSNSVVDNRDARSPRKTGARTPSGLKAPLYEIDYLMDIADQIQSYRRAHGINGDLMPLMPLADLMDVERQTLRRFLLGRFGKRHQLGHFGRCHQVPNYLRFLAKTVNKDDPRQMDLRLVGGYGMSQWRSKEQEVSRAST